MSVSSACVRYTAAPFGGRSAAGLAAVRRRRHGTRGFNVSHVEILGDSPDVATRQRRRRLRPLSPTYRSVVLFACRSKQPAGQSVMRLTLISHVLTDGA